MNSPLAYSIAEACSVARAGRTALYEAIRSGALRAVKRGRRTLVLADDLRHYLESLPAVAPKAVRADFAQRATGQRGRDPDLA
jgi:excisionase family DNA binding protein